MAQEPNRSYWLDLFTHETWVEFKAYGARTTGFRPNRWPRVVKVHRGDYLLCYIIGIQRWVGVLEVVGEPYQADDPKIWVSAVFPSRVDVRVVHELSPETGVPAKELIPKMPWFKRVEGKGPGAWGAFFLGSPQEIELSDALVVSEAIAGAERNPVVRPLPNLRRTPRKVVDTELGKVTVPHDEDDEDPTDTVAANDVGAADLLPAPSEHTEVQALLLELGHRTGHKVFVARNDRSREFEGRRLGDMPGIVDVLPTQFNAATNSVIELIDVLWLNDNAVAAAFEVEKTTSIYSGLLRMSDLLVMQPNITIPIYLVAPDDRRGKVITEVNRPTFRHLARPLSEVCRYISFESLREARLLYGDVFEHFGVSFVRDFLSESCELDK